MDLYAFWRWSWPARQSCDPPPASVQVRMHKCSAWYLLGPAEGGAVQRAGGMVKAGTRREAATGHLLWSFLLDPAFRTQEGGRGYDNECASGADE